MKEKKDSKYWLPITHHDSRYLTTYTSWLEALMRTTDTFQSKIYAAWNCGKMAIKSFFQLFSYTNSDHIKAFAISINPFVCDTLLKARFLIKSSGTASHVL